MFEYFWQAHVQIQNKLSTNSCSSTLGLAWFSMYYILRASERERERVSNSSIGNNIVERVSVAVVHTLIINTFSCAPIANRSARGIALWLDVRCFWVDELFFLLLSRTIGYQGDSIWISIKTKIRWNWRHAICICRNFRSLVTLDGANTLTFVQLTTAIRWLSATEQEAPRICGCRSLPALRFSAEKIVVYLVVW